MLVLSRGAQQSIVFPTCGITLHLLSISGSRIKIGIEAPHEIAVFRGELAEAGNIAFDSRSLGGKGKLSHQQIHDLRNLISSVSLGLQLCQSLLDQGLNTRASDVLSRVMSDLIKLDKCWFDHDLHHCMPNLEAGKSECNGTRKTRILVVEDHENEREFLRGLLELHGYCCESASDGFEAMDLLEQSMFDIALIDVCMPRMDGVSLSRKIRKTRRFDSMQILSVSATSPLDKESDTGRGCFDGWIPKPLNSRELMRHIEASHC